MRIACTGILIVSLAAIMSLSAPGWASAQGNLARLEQQITGTTPVPVQVEPGYLGVELDDSQDGGRGIRILKVVSGGPAEAGGLVAGDLIVSIAGTPVRMLESAADVLSQLPAGSVVGFDVIRNHPTRGDEQIKLKVTLGQRPDASDAGAPALGLAPGTPAAPIEVLELKFSAYGFSARTIDEQLQQRIGAQTTAAVFVTNVAANSPAARGGLQSGDLILNVGTEVVRNPDDLAMALMNNDQRPATLVIVRQGVTRQAELPAWTGEAAMGGAEPAANQQRRGPLVIEPVQPAGDPRIQQLEQRVAALEAQIRALQQAINAGK